MKTISMNLRSLALVAVVGLGLISMSCDKQDEMFQDVNATSQEAELKKLKASKQYRFAGVEAALIFEAGVEKQFDVIVVVAASEKTIVKRLMKRDGITKDDILNRIRSQMPLADKIKRADFVIHNVGSLDELNHKVKRLIIWLNNQER